VALTIKIPVKTIRKFIICNSPKYPYELPISISGQTNFSTLDPQTPWLQRRPNAAAHAYPPYLTTKIYVECACGHTGPVWVRDIVKVYGDQITVADAVQRMRCSACGAKRIDRYRITHPGGSADAMRWAAQGRG